MKSMNIQIAEASGIIRKAIAENGDGLCAGAVIAALDRVSHELKEISLQTTDTKEAMQRYDISAHGEVFKKR